MWAESSPGVKKDTGQTEDKILQLFLNSALILNFCPFFLFKTKYIPTRLILTKISTIGGCTGKPKKVFTSNSCLEDCVEFSLFDMQTFGNLRKFAL